VARINIPEYGKKIKPGSNRRSCGPASRFPRHLCFSCSRDAQYCGGLTASCPPGWSRPVDPADSKEIQTLIGQNPRQGLRRATCFSIVWSRGKETTTFSASIAHQSTRAYSKMTFDKISKEGSVKHRGFPGLFWIPIWLTIQPCWSRSGHSCLSVGAAFPDGTEIQRTAGRKACRTLLPAVVVSQLWNSDLVFEDFVRCCGRMVAENSGIPESTFVGTRMNFSRGEKLASCYLSPDSR